MILINKKKEPYKWKQYRNTPNAKYEPMEELRDSLYEEQGYICAYCMRRIPCKDRIDGKLTQEDHRIEHIKPREHYPELQLDYKNMVACCPGHLGDNEHCGRLKSSDEISFSPMDTAFIATIYYEDGKIKSSNERYTKDIDDVLNLNDEALVKARKYMLAETIALLNRAAGQKPWTKQMVERYIQKYNTMHAENGKMKYHPFCGIVTYYLKKKLRQFA